MNMFGIDFLVAVYYILFSALLIVQQRALRAEKNSFLNSISDEYTTIKKSTEIMVAIGGFLQIISFIYFVIISNIIIIYIFYFNNHHYQNIPPTLYSTYCKRYC